MNSYKNKRAGAGSLTASKQQIPASKKSPTAARPGFLDDNFSPGHQSPLGSRNVKLNSKKYQSLRNINEGEPNLGKQPTSLAQRNKGMYEGDMSQAFINAARMTQSGVGIPGRH